MSFKDKPKRGGPKPFERETKPRTAPKSKVVADAPAKKPARKLPPAPATMEAEGKPERISKILARAGIASRRDVERMILEGRVRLNGALLETPVVNATMADKIEVDGTPIRGIERTRLWLYHKPAGLVTTNADPEGRATVFENLPGDLPRVMSVGRLDINTEGLLLLTNDGGLSRVLELPTTGWLRRYRVRAHGEIDQAELDKLKDGIAVDGVLYGAIDATLDRAQGHNVWISMGLREGKNREIKNVLGALGLEVNRLIRISYGPFQLGDLPEGQVLEVRGRMLRDQLGPRLIADSKANFDAPIYGHAPEAEEEAAAPARAARPERSEWSREKPEDRRERALGRLDTQRDGDKSRERSGDKPRGRDAGKDFGAKSGGKGFAAKGGARGFADKGGARDGDDRPKRPALGTSRTANVWMAPGARPTTDDKGRKTSARAEAEQLFKKPGPQNDRPIVVNRVAGDSDWIRAEGQDEGGRDDKRGGFGAKKSFGDRGDRPERGERSFGDRPRGEGRSEGRSERSFGDRPSRDGGRDAGRDGGDRPRGKSFSSEGRSDRPRSDRPFSDRPSRGERPAGDRPFRGKPAGDRRPREDGDGPRRSYSEGRSQSEGRPGRAAAERVFSDRPPRDRAEGDRPAGDRPRGARPGGPGKPGGGKSFGGKPGGFSGKPRGERSGDARPAGGPRGAGKPSGSRPGGPAKGGGRPGGSGGRGPSSGGRGRPPKG